MPVPPNSHPCWQKLATGALSRIRTEHLGTQLLIKNMERSSDPVPTKVANLQAYFTRFERTLGKEIDQLTRV